MSISLSLDQYRLLGRSGLRVSPLALGTLTFGTEEGIGADESEARRMFDLYVERGGNFVDTANAYNGGTAERLIGAFVKGRRDRLVIATKYSLQVPNGDANSSGNHRKSLIQSVERSLRQLNTHYIDLLYLHFWDGTTGVEEILRGMDDLVRSGKILYAGISNTPAWQIARLQTIADFRGWVPLVALQTEYSLIERTAESDLIPMSRELGLGVIPWSPLGGGVLTAKYLEGGGGTRAPSERRNWVLESGSLCQRNLEISAVVAAVAGEQERTAAQIALAWTLINPAVVSSTVGARTLKQLEDNLVALEVRLSDDQLKRLDAASQISLGSPHAFLSRNTQRGLGFIEISPRVADLAAAVNRI